MMMIQAAHSNVNEASKPVMVQEKKSLKPESFQQRNHLLAEQSGERLPFPGACDQTEEEVDLMKLLGLSLFRKQPDPEDIFQGSRGQGTSCERTFRQKAPFDSLSFLFYLSFSLLNGKTNYYSHWIHSLARNCWSRK